MMALLVNVVHAQSQELEQVTEQQKRDTTERIAGKDGWYTMERTVVDGDVVVITQREYDADGNIAHKVIFTRNAGDDDTMRVVRYGANGVQTTITDLATEDGKFVELANEQHGKRRHVTFGVNPVTWTVQRDKATYSLGVVDDHFTITQDDVVVETVLPLRVDDATGALSALHGDQWTAITVLPQVIAQKARAVFDIDTPITYKLIVRDDVLVYSAAQERTIRLFGIFPLAITRFVLYDVADGHVRATSAPTPWLDRLSF